MDTNKETDTGITKRQRLINEAVEDLVATRTDHNLVIRFNKIMKTKDIPLMKAAHKAVHRRVVDAVEKAQENKDPECPLWEYLQDNAYFEQKLEHVVYLFEGGYAPQ